MKKLLSLLLLTGTLFAQANNVFTLNPSVSSAGMGNVGIAHADVKNVFHNPAFAGLNKRHQEVSYVKWLPNLSDDMGYQNILYTSSLGWSGELFYFDYGTQTEADQGGIIIGDFESASYRISGGYGFQIKDWMFGARLNIYNHNLIDDIDIGMNYGVDLGVYKEFGNTSLGIVLKDVGGETEILEQSLNLPMSVGIGVGQKFGNFTLASDIKMFEDYNSIGLGGVYDLGIASFKLGYYTESEFEVDYITLGGSIDAGIVDLSLAYYYNTESFHNETIMLSFGFDL
tara:strand:- start:272 stop:1126 length:855 start_codon:yes stop_codon:yes gene_type:complete